MLRKRLTTNSAVLVACVVVGALLLTPSLRGADRTIDLDGDPSNGEESTVRTRVVQTFPVKIENVIFNNATGESFTFEWAGAGPGGFSSIVTAGPDVGTQWEWTTVSQLYSIDSPIVFKTDFLGIPVFGGLPGGLGMGGEAPAPTRGFGVPGKSIFPSSVTLSDASLTSSLVTFFSPRRQNASCDGTFLLGVAEQSINNPLDVPLSLSYTQQDCCDEPQQIICDEECKSYLVDVTNCGGCGVTCAFDETCEAGICDPICEPGFSLCGEGPEDCFDFQDDELNCGGCGVTCAFDETCEAGICDPICEPGFSLCGEGPEDCFDFQGDELNCGGCGVTCAFDETCEAGSCEPICEAGFSLCGTGPEDCVNLQTDVTNCGDCNVNCAFDEYCGSGVCEPICQTGLSLCGESEEDCVNLQDDTSNCGACGVTCAFDEYCAMGSCEPICAEGLSLCGASEEDCVDLLSNPLNCGSCGVTCAFDETCDAGACEPVCDAGLTFCNGECPDLQNSSMHCGACGAQCASDEFCEEGSCQPICEFSMCGEACIDLQNDPGNCGECDNRCDLGQRCRNATCEPMCTAGQLLCGETCVDGSSDPNNCGACGNVCGDGSACLMGSCSDGETAPSRSDDSGVPGFTVLSVSDTTAQDSPSDARATPSSRASDPANRRGPRVRTRQSLRGGSVPGEVPAHRRGSTILTETAMVRDGLVEAPVCSLPSVETVIPPGETFTQCVSGSAGGKEVFLTASASLDGETIVGQGPCGAVVPDPDLIITPFHPTPTAVRIVADQTGDLLSQPGERVSVLISVQNIGPEALSGPIAMLRSDPDGFNPLPISFVSGNDTSGYPDFPALTGAGDCETPAQLDPKTNFMVFTFTWPDEQEGDVGRRFDLDFQVNGGAESIVTMPLVLGVGSACNPLTDIDGETYDHLDGFQSPLNVQLVPVGNPVQFSNKKYNRGSTVPMKLTLACGAQILGDADIDPSPAIVGLRHEILGEQSLEGINGDNNANPDDPSFSCGSSGCDYQFRTEQLGPGRYVVTVKMPDAREFEAGFTIR